MSVYGETVGPDFRGEEILPLTDILHLPDWAAM